ncbi:monosaccharide transporter [Cryptococcus wingfieldii CBS 7118]|uniref:Monosaccharide transporter n=1 Tax=Cryptococcus wingfieldii CBS 7118 TaxID=1295528 RepID=A0A1E3K678_9TREE|nr:monosaccharide transporter [Cryptococcus wingfieldii CBS 7118]ODO08579.1 monosaccharide transporter [Cryptococcus wingfieldii CBS 7118]
MPYLGLRGKALLGAISATAGTGFCLFGIDNASLGGVISSVPFDRRYHLDTTGQGAVTGAYEIGCFFGALFFAVCGERAARRTIILIAIIPLLIGTVLQVASYSVAQLSVGRVVAGIAMGAITATLPVWQNETSPAALRGTLICATLSMLVVGQLIAYWTAYGLLDRYDNDMTWRVMFSLQGMAGVIMGALLLFMPESPRFLLSHDRPEEARQVLAALADLPDEDPVITTQMNEIVRAIELEHSSAKSWKDLLTRGKDSQREKRRMLTVTSFSSCQAFSGSTVFSYQEAIGMSSHTSTLLSGFLQIFFLICSFGTWWLIEHAGRRRLFLLTAFAMAVSMFAIGGLVKQNTKPTGIAAAVLVFAYQGFFSWGWMAGVWVYSSEICPLSWRSKGMGLAVALQWLFDFVLLMVTPIGIGNIGYGMFILFGGFNLCFIPFVYFFCPETAGVPLESIDAFFILGVDPIKESERIRREIREASQSREEELLEVGALTEIIGEYDEKVGAEK